MVDSVEDLEELRESFELIDTNGNGSICAEELGTLLRACGENPSKKEIETYIAKCAKNKENRIEFDDFVRLIAETRGPKARPNYQKQKLQTAFSCLDHDNSGFIDINELTKICTGLGEKLSKQELAEMFKVVDINSDGKIDIKEFEKFVMKSASKQPMGHSKQNHHKKKSQ